MKIIQIATKSIDFVTNVIDIIMKRIDLGEIYVDYASEIIDTLNTNIIIVLYSTILPFALSAPAPLTTSCI